MIFCHRWQRINDEDKLPRAHAQQQPFRGQPFFVRVRTKNYPCLSVSIRGQISPLSSGLRPPVSAFSFSTFQLFRTTSLNAPALCSTCSLVSASPLGK